MPSLLSAGAGASEGLDTLLTRLLTQQQLEQQQQRLTEESRHNRATEGNANLSITENAKFRADRLKEAESALVDKTVANRGIGDPVTEQEYTKETGAGYPSGTYDIKPGQKVTALSGFSSLPNQSAPATLGGPRLGSPDVPDPGKLTQTPDESSPMNGSRLISFKGTEGQRLARQKEQDTLNRPDSGQQHTYALTDPQLATQFGKKVGEPIDAVLDPKTLRIHYQGVDVTKGVDHYEKPPAPDRTLIMTGDSYMPRSQAAATLAKGGTVPLAETAQTRSMGEGATMIQRMIPGVAADAEQLDKVGLFGPLMSRVRDKAAKLGTVELLASGDPDKESAALISIGNAISSDPELATDRLTGKFATELGLLASGAGRVHGGSRGGGSIQMVSYFKDLLSASATLPMFLGRLDGLSAFMADYAQGPGGPKAGGDASDPLGIRNKK